VKEKDIVFEYPVKDEDGRTLFHVYGVSSMVNPKDHTILFLTAKNLDEADGIQRCRNCLIFIPHEYQGDFDVNGHVFVRSDNPRRDYAMLLGRLVSEEDFKDAEYVNGSWISPAAVIGEHTVIGPGCYIGRFAEIGDDCVLYPGVRLHGRVKIGDRVIIRDNTVIGTQGFGFVDDEEGNKIRVPFLGNVVIEDDVEIGALCNIETAVADSTVIKHHVKIDSMSMIEHDGYIGENTLLVGVKLAGHVHIGQKCFVGLGAAVRQRIRIGEHCTIGAGSVVVKHVADHTTVAGVPAKAIRK